MNMFYKSMAIVLSLSAGLQAMEYEQGPIYQEHKRINLIPTEKENAHKMWLIKKAIDEEKLPWAWIYEDIRIIIGRKLHELCANPVLDGELVYTDNEKKKTFKIRNLVKEDGSLDLSDDIFGEAQSQLLITTDPEMFFRIDTQSEKLHILIAPKFLIQDKIETTTKHFKPIMDKWIPAGAPIGIFYRLERWCKLGYFYYLTSQNLAEISKNNLYENWKSADCWLPVARARRPCQIWWQKISCSF